MTNPQGTIWEGKIRDRARAFGFQSDRYPKRSQKHEPDLYIQTMRNDYHFSYPVLFWKRLVGKKGSGPRKPDGERNVVVIGYDDFMEMLSLMGEEGIPLRLEVQAKWAANVNVTRILGGLRDWLKGNPSWPNP